jgi:hypothetical protein
MSRKALKAKPIELPDIPWRMTRGEKKRHRKLSDQLGVSFKDSSQLYRDLQGYRESDWDDTVHVFEANPRSFYNAWHYLNNHPVFWTFGEPRDGKVPEVHERNLQHEHGMTFGNGLEVTVHRVDPKTNSTSEDPARNTRTEVWYELSLTHWPTHPHYPIHIHDYEGDGGAKTYEKAIVRAARKVHELYGNDRKILDAQLEDKPEPENACHCPAHQKSREALAEAAPGWTGCHPKPEQEKSREGTVHRPLTPIMINTRKPGKWRFVDTETKQVWFWDDSSNTFKLIDPVTDAQELADADLLADPDLQESLAQMRRGDTVPATTLAEEWERKAKEAEEAFARIEIVLRDFTVRGGYQPAYDTAVRLIREAIAGPDGS